MSLSVPRQVPIAGGECRELGSLPRGCIAASGSTDNLIASKRDNGNLGALFGLSGCPLGAAVPGQRRCQDLVSIQIHRIAARPRRCWRAPPPFGSRDRPWLAGCGGIKRMWDPIKYRVPQRAPVRGFRSHRYSDCKLRSKNLQSPGKSLSERRLQSKHPSWPILYLHVGSCVGGYHGPHERET